MRLQRLTPLFEISRLLLYTNMQLNPRQLMEVSGNRRMTDQVGLKSPLRFSSKFTSAHPHPWRPRPHTSLRGPAHPSIDRPRHWQRSCGRDPHVIAYGLLSWPFLFPPSPAATYPIRTANWLGLGCFYPGTRQTTYLVGASPFRGAANTISSSIERWKKQALGTLEPDL